jgi:uncharacterized protein YbbC (DUF1343 family)
MTRVINGIDRLDNEKQLQERFTGNVALLCHGPSVNSELEHSLGVFKRTFGNRLVAAFSPQHGFVGDVQDNMVESNHFRHPYFDVKIYSLYSETRIPTDEMLAGIDHLFIDMQDVGTRIYTYIYTMTYLLEACAGKDIEVIILDRPNPINGVDIEGNILDDKNWASFVGRHPIPVRHGLTMAEVALMHQKFWAKDKCNLTVIEMSNWKRNMSFEDTGLPWVIPSPNLPTVDGCYTFPATVIFEGVKVSEGRGTTRSLEMVGHPSIEPYAWLEELQPIIDKEKMLGFTLRPTVFLPTFQKFAGKACGGFQIHVTDRKSFTPWKVGQFLMREFMHKLGNEFGYKEEPYEYEYDKNALDVINGGPELRAWCEKRGDFKELYSIEMKGRDKFVNDRNSILIYP